MILFWMITMVNNKFDVISYSFLMYVIKRRDVEGLIYLANALVDCLTLAEFGKVINNFIEANIESLDEDDLLFFQNSANNFIDNQSEIITKRKQEKSDIFDDIDMRKITKAVALFEKNGLVMGTDYSFYQGKIRMKKECQEKIKKLLGKG